MTKLEMIKGGLGLLVGLGVGKIADNALKLVKPGNVKGINKIAIAVGGFAISMMAADKVTQHVDVVWDQTESQIRGLFGKKKSEEESIDEEE